MAGEDELELEEPGHDDEPGADEAARKEAKRERDKQYRERKRKGTTRRRSTPTQSEIRSRLRESFAELSAALEERDPELSGALKRDGDKMADLLSKWGEHPKTPPPVKVAVVVIAEVLEPLRAFGATVRILLRRLRQRRLARFDEQPEPGEPLPFPAGYEPELDQVETPSRFRVDAEPPDVN